MKYFQLAGGLLNNKHQEIKSETTLTAYHWNLQLFICNVLVQIFYKSKEFV